MDILQEIVECTKDRIEAQKKIIPPKELMEKARLRHNAESENGSVGFPFEKALRTGDIAFICEIKKASPSKGIIAEDFPYISIARSYEAAGADAISVLTEPYYYMGDDLYLREIADAVRIPLLRRDFIIDSYMIYDAKVLGAHAIHLICTILDRDSLSVFLRIAHSLGLSALVEVHDESDIDKALAAGTRIIGISNRNQKALETDVYKAVKLRSKIPQDVVVVCGGGVRNASDVELLSKNNVSAVLLGETLMLSRDKKTVLAKLRGD